MRLRLTLPVFILCAIFATPARSQKKVNFDKVTLEELQMTTYAPDSTASAVILLDLGRFNGNELVFTRKMRVKILTKAGLDWGNWSFNTPTKGDFKVVTHNLVDGKIVSEKADSKSIHTEEVIDGIEVYKVFASNVKVGSVVDITYSHFGVPFEWRFQERIPMVFNELILEDTEFISYKKTHYGFQPIETISLTQWRSKNMPAFQVEPFLSTYANYITKFEFQIESIGTPGKYYVAFSTTWKNVIDNLLKATRFGGVINGSAFLNDFAKETKAKNLTTKEKIQAAYDYIQANMKWDGSNTLFASSELRSNFLVNHNGTSADINLALISLLNKMDIMTYPVVLSTRANGLLVQFSPTISKLNYVVAYVQHEDVDMVLDATSEYIGSPGMLPARCLNGNGLLVKKDNEQWIALNKGFSQVRKQFITITMDNAGVAKAKVFQDYVGYGFLEWMNDLKANNNDKEIQKNKIQKEHPDVAILSYDITKMDPKTVSGKESLELDISSQLVDAGSDLILNPFVMFEYANNPFKSEDRKYPVDLNYPREVHATISVMLPKEYAVKQIPPSAKFSNTDGSASFTYLASNTGNNIQFRVILKINKYVFTESEYKDLRVFFSEVVKKINTPVELSKT